MEPSGKEEDYAPWTLQLHALANEARRLSGISDRFVGATPEAIRALRDRNEAFDRLDTVLSGPNSLRLLTEHAEMAELLAESADLFEKILNEEAMRFAKKGWSEAVAQVADAMKNGHPAKIRALLLKIRGEKT